MPSTSSPRCCWNANRIIEVGVEQVQGHVFAGGQIGVGVLDQAEGGQRRPDLGDGEASITATQRVADVPDVTVVPDRS
jgi:hypothetical protein